MNPLSFRRCSHSVGVAALLAIASFGVALAQPTPPVDSSSAIRLIKIVSADRAATKVQSVLFGVWIGTEPMLITAAGESIGGVPATSAMHIRPGIVETEALTTILVQLSEEGRVSLDAPLSRWFPSLREAKHVTLRMLANSRSGYGDYLADKAFIKRLYANPFQTFKPAELIAIGLKQPMTFRPGAAFKYSHTNAVLLGEAVQRIAGASLAQLVQARIAHPLHLTQTAIPGSSDVPAPVQHLFLRDRGPYEESTYWDPSWAINSGTIVSTIGDVAMMQRAFGRGQLVSKKGFAELLAPTNAASPPQSKNFYYGLGIIVGNTWILQHAQVAGSDVVMGYLPSRDLTIVVSTAFGVNSAPSSAGYSSRFFEDAALYLAPERPVPSAFFGKK